MKTISNILAWIVDKENRVIVAASAVLVAAVAFLAVSVDWSESDLGATEIILCVIAGSLMAGGGRGGR